MADIGGLLCAARTANTFADEPVTDEQLRAVYDLVKWAPTSANCQPLRLLAVGSATARARLLPLISVQEGKAQVVMLCAPFPVSGAGYCGRRHTGYPVQCRDR